MCCCSFYVSQVKIQDLRGAMGDDARPELDAVLTDFACVNLEADEDGDICLDTLLIAAVRSGEAWLVQQLVNAMSQAMECRFFTRPHTLPLTTNPLDITCDFRGKMVGKRPDRAEVDALAMGHGSSETQDVADNVHAHCRAWNAFQHGGARKVGNIQGSQVLILRRYLAAGCAWMKAARHYTLANDGFRVGGKEMLMGTIMARVGGQVKAMWCMPQADNTNTI